MKAMLVNDQEQNASPLLQGNNARACQVIRRTTGFTDLAAWLRASPTGICCSDC